MIGYVRHYASQVEYTAFSLSHLTSPRYGLNRPWKIILMYQYIIDYEYEGNKDGLPPFAFVYYRGSNDAWDGYGGAVVYTQAAKLPTSLIPRLKVAAQKVGHSWDEFTVTDNTCKKQDESDKLGLRTRFLGDAVLQTEKQLQAQATRFRGNAVNSIKAQKLFFNNQVDDAQRAFENLRDQTINFEQNK